MKDLNYPKYRIKKCLDKDYWYKDKVGDIILAKQVNWHSVLKYDIERITNEYKSIGNSSIQNRI